MTCSYGPYKITSNLEAVGEYIFIDNELSRRVAVFSDCAETVSPPCADAVALHIEDGCPDSCKIYWYECPSEMGRQYTILPTPCGVKVSSFEDGLIAVDGCDATLFGSEIFCFGKIYTDMGAFDSPDQSLTTFEFDGHTFTIQGELGDCNELYNCPECQTGSQLVTAFEDLPTPPEDISAPEAPSDDEVISDIDTPETEVIPAEGRVAWNATWKETATPFGQDTLCEGEKPLTGSTAIGDCASNDNPSIATLPSGHTVVAYENRGEDGIAKITVAILSSSVKEQIRSHRKLGTGTLLNDIFESGGTGTFIVYEDMNIPVDVELRPASDEKIGFLTGPPGLVGKLFTITKLRRFRDADVIRHEFTFTAGTNVKFPDKNHIYNVNWFIVDNQGSDDLPSSENITTILDLPNHVDGEGNSVPVSNPSIAVAQNNKMVSPEQNIYIAYQAFEDNQWRVYLREIVLGTEATDEFPTGPLPAYISPYLFDENVRKVELFTAAPAVQIMGDVPAITFYDESFSGAGLTVGQSITTGRWAVLDDRNIAPWFWFNQDVDNFVLYTNTPFILCDAQGPTGATGLPATGCSGQGGTACSAVFNSQSCGDLGVDDSIFLLDHTRSFAVSRTPTTFAVEGGIIHNAINLSFKMRFHIVVNTSGASASAWTEYPDIWFLIGRRLPENVNFSDGYRLQIRRGKELETDTMNNTNPAQADGRKTCNQACGSAAGCFIFQLYKNKSPRWAGNQDFWFERTEANGSQDDLPTRILWKCIEEADLGQPGDYSFDDWNEWRLETYVRGFFRFFELYLTHPNGAEVLMVTFREWEESISPQDYISPYDLGPFHGFGVSQSMGSRPERSSKHQVLIDSFSAKTRPSSNSDKIYFLEDFCERDAMLQNAPLSNVEFGTPMMKDEPITTNTIYVGSDLNYVDAIWGDRFYPTDITVAPPFTMGGFQLGPAGNQNFPPSGWASLLRLRPITNDRDPTGGASSLDSISMIISVNRLWRSHDGAWPHVWLVGRLEGIASPWFDRYRLRISRFNCVSDYASVGRGPSPVALSTGDKVWRISAYNSGSGLKTDAPYAEKFLIIGTDTPLEWIEYAASGGGPTSKGQSIWNYFRIDMYDSDGQVIFDVYVGDDTPPAPEPGENLQEMHPDDIQFTLLTSISVSPIPSGIDGGFFGAAFFSGANDESVEGLLNDDYRSSAHVNYISLSTIGAAGAPPTGACCRSIGGCDDNVLNTDCEDPDIWKINQICGTDFGEAGCAVDFPVGAGCTSDGNCHDGITEEQATIDGIGTCTDCEWQVNENCNSRDCPEATLRGSCCLPGVGVLNSQGGPRCIANATLADCQRGYGNTPIFPGAFVVGRTCNEGCPPIEGGRCCLLSGCVVTRTAQECIDQGGINNWLNTHHCFPIDSAQCPIEGACCDGVGGCTQETRLDCEALSVDHIFLGIGEDCSPTNPCTDIDPIGACCYDTGTCDNTIESACPGTWFSDAVCTDDPCPVATGACCNRFTGVCIDDVSANDCRNIGRDYRGDGSTCDLADCIQPIGACCVGLDCVGGQTQQQCADLGGDYKGDVSNCLDNICLEGEDPYLEITVNYKPEDLWVIETSPNEYATRVLYHMQEEIIVSSSLDPNVDFMFLIDHSSVSMDSVIDKISIGIPLLSEKLAAKGLDVRFGFSFFGRNEEEPPSAPSKTACNCTSFDIEMADGLQSTTRCQPGNPDQLEGEPLAVDGFTRNTNYLQRALTCWGAAFGTTSPWAAIQFALDSSEFIWRDSADKIIFFVTRARSDACPGGCPPWSANQADAEASLANAGAMLIPLIRGRNTTTDGYFEVASGSGWTGGGDLNIDDEDYENIFEEVVNVIDFTSRTDHAAVIERATKGTGATYLSKGEVIITYDGDLSDLWTFNKADFEFQDKHVPFPGTNTKQLVSFPFELASGKIYGIDSVHIQGNPNNWVSFGDVGALIYDHPDVGHRASGTSETPILISTNASRPRVYVNNRNQVMVAYENYSTGAPQIEIKGTGDFHQNSITGPKARRIVRLLNQNDFTYRHTITLPREGANQLCDFIIDNSDITHVVWQSSRDGYWEIYYGNSFNMFDPVRITKVESRSSHPSIDVDEAGSIFVVYHDNRFGPFNIMLSSKDEERVIPLLEQDAYLASLRTGYTHYTNILPVFLDNPAGEVPDLGQFWASKKENGAGNDSENFVYKVSETTGVPSDGFDLSSSGQEAIAFSSTAIWGITSEGVLSRLGNIDDSNEVSFSPEIIGTIDLNMVNRTIRDMTVDKFDRIWVMIYESADDNIELINISSFNASTVATGIITDAGDNLFGSPFGCIAVTPDNIFYIMYDQAQGGDAEQNMFSSVYPSISEGVATFNWQFIAEGIGGFGSPDPAFIAMTADATGTLHVVSSGNDLYTISKVDGAINFVVSLTTGSGDEPSLPVGATSGIAYQILDVTKTGAAEFFHVRIDFYDNITFEGDVFLSVDSRENLEAFINEETLDDPYVFGMDARGIFLELDEIGIVFFDATNFVPGFSRLSQPYSFEPNQTYFPKVFLVQADGGVRESGLPQPNSFSCTKCSRFGNNNFNTSACSYSFVVPNNTEDTQSFNFQIDFYADTGKQHIIRRFEAIPGSDDLQYMEVDNKPATEQWDEFGLPILAGDLAFIQIHPVLDPTAGFLCGVTYTVQVNECHALGEMCSNFSKISSSNWSSSLVGGANNTIDDQIGVGESLIGLPGVDSDNEVMLGLSMKTINNKLSVAWRTPGGDLNFAQLNDAEWTSETVVPKTVSAKVVYCDLADINGLPSISYIVLRISTTMEEVVTLDGSWNAWPNMSNFQNGILVNPRSLLEYRNQPMTTFISRGDGTGQPTFVLNSTNPNDFASPRTGTWHTAASCHPPFETVSGGSCTTTLATINGLPAVAWIGGGLVRYGRWIVVNLVTDTFSNLDVVSAGESLIPGKVALVEVDGQPAIAYIQAVAGGLGILKYKRFDGASWIDTPTNGQALDFNKNVAMTVINGQPYIAYSVKTSATTSQLRYAFHNGTKFIDELVEDDLNQVDHVVDIAEFNNEPAIIISANPFRVYFLRTLPSHSVDEISPVFFCECSSKIFTNRLTHLNEVARWESSAHGFSDTPVTDSPKDSLRPTMRTRKTGAAIVIWEDHNKSSNCTNPPCIRAATFRNVNQDQLRASGTKSWFDYDFGISGQDSDLALDLYERVNAIYEKPKPPSDADELPGNELYGKVCDFTAADASIDPQQGACDISALENNVISFDQFISKKIVRKIRVKEEFVQYHTYNASGTLTPIVSTCNIALEIHGTPEIVALRFKNENRVVWGPWCPWSPQISDFVMEKEHRISGGSGVKEICIQAMTYVGITTEFCLPIVADYETVIFETLFYRSTDSEGNEVTNFSAVTSGFFPADLDAKLVALPLSDGISVASLGSFAGGGNLCPKGTECLEGQECVNGQCVCVDSSGCGENEICLSGRCVPKTARILVEIIPNQDLDEETINFDVVQQGSNDLRARVSNKGKNNDGRILYRGEFTIEREDKVFNTDGLARVSPAFPSACEDAGSETVGVSDTYTRDIFNETGEDITVEGTGSTDPLVDFRQTTSGRIGVSLDIRSSEDPYFVFGDPDYSLRQRDGRRLGVPFRITETEITTGSDVDQDGDDNGDEETGG